MQHRVNEKFGDAAAVVGVEGTGGFARVGFVLNISKLIFSRLGMRTSILRSGGWSGKIDAGVIASEKSVLKYIRN